MSPAPNPTPTMAAELASLHMALRTQAEQINAIAAASARRDEQLAQIATELSAVAKAVEAVAERVEPLEKAAQQIEGAMKFGRLIGTVIVFLGVIGISLRVGVDVSAKGQ